MSYTRALLHSTPDSGFLFLSFCFFSFFFFFFFCTIWYFAQSNPKFIILECFWNSRISLRLQAAKPQLRQTLDFLKQLEYSRIIPTSRVLLLLSTLPRMVFHQIFTGPSPTNCSVPCSEVISLQRLSLTTLAKSLHPLLTLLHISLEYLL